jgi:hypothetical protein
MKFGSQQQPKTKQAQRFDGVDDSALVAQFLAGEKRAFDELVDRNSVRLFKLVHQTIGVYSRVPPPASFRSVEEVFDVGIYDCR